MNRETRQKDGDIRKYRIKKILEEIKIKRGRGTELISLYIPPKKRMSDIINYLRQEYATAENIKSDTTRKHVKDAITKVIERLKHYQTAPENGLVVFCGAIPVSGPGTEKMEIYVLEPPEPININLYRCDDHFHTQYIEDTLKEKELYGLVSIDVNEAAIGILEGNRLEIFGKYTSGIPGKHRAGGQSARRFERLREMAVHQYYDRVAKHLNQEFLREDIFYRLNGIIIGGPGFTKNEFLEDADIDYRLKKKVVAVIDTNYAGEDGLRELIEKAKDIMSDIRYIREKKFIDEFLSRLSRRHNVVIYGLKDVIDNIYSGAYEALLILEDIGMDYLVFRCPKCGESKEFILDQKDALKLEYRPPKCENCNVEMSLIIKKDIIEYIATLSDEYNFDIILISSNTEHGKIFKQFGGIAALLRYPISY